MIKVHGIKTCGSVRKALKFFSDNDIEIEFIDIRKTPVPCQKIKEWAKKEDINILFNNKGTKYRQLGLKELNLDESGKLEWLCRENMLLKRPVIEYGDKLVVGFDEERYKETFR